MRTAYVLIAALAAACSSGGSTPTGTGSPSPSGESFAVAVGGSRVVPGTDVTVAFLRVEEDSRCALGVLCVWAGNGRIALRLSQGVATREVELNTTVLPRETEFAGLRIELQALEPYPVHAQPTDPDDYVATFEVGND